MQHSHRVNLQFLVSPECSDQQHSDSARGGGLGKSLGVCFTENLGILVRYSQSLTKKNAMVTGEGA